MRKKTVKLGLNYILFGIVLIILATFYHGQFAWLFFPTMAAEARFTFLGLFLGGLSGGFGVLIAVAGLLQNQRLERDVRLAPLLVILLAAFILFFMLLYSSSVNPGPPQVQPGETITI